MALRVTFPRLRGLARGIGLAALFFAAALFGTAGGVMFAFSGDLPAISALNDYSPGVITRVLARDGSAVGEFATERRQLVTYEEIPDVLRNAIISAEDGDFMRRRDAARADVPRVPQGSRVAPHARPEHDHPAARAAALP
jgi:membrane peptidoglycan carboxypeptidase